MNKRLLVVAGALCVTMGLSACTTNPYTGESEAGKSGIGAGLGAALGAGVGMLSSSKHDRGKGALIGAAAGAALGGGADHRSRPVHPGKDNRCIAGRRARTRNFRFDAGLSKYPMEPRSKTC